MQAAFQQAAIPKPFQVLGRTLYPYTLGHDILLGLVDSCFAIGSKAHIGDDPLEAINRWNDLLISVWICSHESYESAFKTFCSPFTWLKVRLWAWRCGKFDMAAQLEKFKAYIETNTSEPEYWIESKTGGKQSGIPSSQFLKVTMRREFGMSEQEALDTPHSQANFNYLTILESNGKIRLMSEDDRALLHLATDPELDKKLQALAQRILNN